jgi:hypothetical protein
MNHIQLALPSGTNLSRNDPDQWVLFGIVGCMVVGGCRCQIFQQNRSIF